MNTLADDSECRGLCLISLICSFDSLKRFSGELNSMFCRRFIAASSHQGKHSWKSRVDYLMAKYYFPAPKFFSLSLSIQKKKSQTHIELKIYTDYILVTMRQINQSLHDRCRKHCCITVMRIRLISLYSNMNLRVCACQKKTMQKSVNGQNKIFMTFHPVKLQTLLYHYKLMLTSLHYYQSYSHNDAFHFRMY